jgi:hypothetical protein
MIFHILFVEPFNNYLRAKLLILLVFVIRNFILHSHIRHSRIRISHLFAENWKNSTFVSDHLMNFMEKFLISILVLLIPFFGFTQTDTKEKKVKEKENIYLDASFGASFPLGNYAKEDPKVKETGYAKPGFFIQANADWMGKNNFGLALQLTYQNNSLKDAAKTIYHYDTTNPIAGNWSNIYVMAGPVFLKQIKKMVIDAKLVGGFLISMSPWFKTFNPETKLTEGGTGTGFALGVNIGVGYAISPEFAVKLTLGYLAGFPKIDRQYNVYVIGLDSSGQYIYSSPMDITIKKTVSTFNAGAGIIYKF